MIELIKQFNGKDIIRNIDDPEEKRFAKILLELETLRQKHPKTKHAKEQQFKQLEELANDLKKCKKLKTHDRNYIMNVILESQEEYKIKNNTKHKLTDVLLYILFAQPKPIHGRIGIIKQVFLTIKEILGEENVENHKFIPYRYGPYSFLVTHVISNLEYDGLINIQGRRNTSSEKFTLTERGIKIAQKRFTKLPQKLQSELIDRRKGWDQNHVQGLLAYVYNKYPEYTEKSLLKQKYPSITWGRTRG